MPKPVVLTANFQVANVDISMQCAVGLFFVFFRNSLLKNLGTERKSKRKLFTCAQFPRSTFVLFSAFRMDTKLLASVHIHLQ